MGKEIEAQVVIGGSHFRHKSGYEVSVTSISPIQYVKPGETAIHEAAHGVINPSNVKSITREPGPGYLGKTEVYALDTVMAAGSIADGHSGTGHDMMIVNFFGNPGTDVPTAKSILASRKEHKNALAGAVEAHGTLSNGQVRAVMDEVDNGRPVIIKEKQPNGEIRERAERVRWNAKEIRILANDPEGESDLARAA